VAFGSFNKSGNTAPMAEINVIPLVDIMLVLLVIFIITAPLLTNAVKIDLPHASSQTNLTKPDNIQLAIDADANVYWNGEKLDRTTMIARMQSVGKAEPVPEVHLHADRNTRYETLADVMAEASKAGLSRIGFVSDPRPAAP
jgi:biopolymer transport protein ExbD